MSCVIVLEGELRSRESLKIVRGWAVSVHQSFLVIPSKQDKLKSVTFTHSLSISSNIYLFSLLLQYHLY